MIDGEPWFVAKDVCNVLKIKSNAVTIALRKLPEEMICLYPIQTLKGERLVNHVSEAGLYQLIMRSDKPEAQAFQNWIASEVLPAIRKNGIYMTDAVAQEVVENPLDFLKRATQYAEDRIRQLEEDK